MKIAGHCYAFVLYVLYREPVFHTATCEVPLFGDIVERLYGAVGLRRCASRSHAGVCIMLFYALGSYCLCMPNCV